MNNFRLVAVVSAAISLCLAACGGGGGSGIPGPGPTPPPHQTKSVHFSWTTGAAGVRINGIHLKVKQNDTVVGNDVELGTDPGPGNLGGAVQATVTVTVVDALGSPVPEPSPTLVVDNTQDAAITQPGDPVIITAQQQAGATGLAASYPDTTSGTLPVDVYNTLAIACQWQNTSQGLTYASGSPVQVTDPSQADIAIEGPNCPPAFNNATDTLLFQYGYELLGPGTLNSITNATSFVSAGTSLDNQTLENGIIAGTTTGVMFKTSTGSFVKWHTQTFEGIQAIGGLSLLSDNLGNFAF